MAKKKGALKKKMAPKKKPVPKKASRIAKKKPAVKKNRPMPKKKPIARRTPVKIAPMKKRIAKKSAVKTTAAKKPMTARPNLSPVSAPSQVQTPKQMMKSLETPALPAPPVASPPPIFPTEPEPPLPPIQRAGQMEPDLEILPGWEDRHRLKRVMFEDGLQFFSTAKDSPDHKSALSLLARCAKDARMDKPGYFMVHVKDRAGKIIGVMDGHSLSDGVVAICRSCAKDDRVRDLHLLLYCAALTGKNPSYVCFSSAACPLSQELAGRLIILGRGFGMSALPTREGKSMVFLRRVKKELDPVSSGAEISKVLNSLSALEPSMRAMADDFAKKSVVALIPLPVSPDTREHLHELRDAVTLLGIDAEQMQSVLDSLRDGYVLSRKDITPSLLM